MWQDGVEIFKLENIRTRYTDGNCEWSVNNYGANISPAPTVIYVDDVAISTARLAESATLFVLPDSQSSATSFFLASVPIFLKRELALGLPEPRIHWPRFVATGGSS